MPIVPSDGQEAGRPDRTALRQREKRGCNAFAGEIPDVERIDGLVEEDYPGHGHSRPRERVGDCLSLNYVRDLREASGHLSFQALFNRSEQSICDNLRCHRDSVSRQGNLAGVKSSPVYICTGNGIDQTSVSQVMLSFKLC